MAVSELPVLHVSALRARFPGLSRQAGGRPAILADAPGGTQVPRSVIEAMAGYLERSNANTGGAFPTSRDTDDLIERARVAAGSLVGADPDEVVFGPNMTTLSFVLSRSLATVLEPGDELVVTVLDHDANVAPWLAVAAERGARVRWVDVVEPDCTLDLDGLAGALSDRTRLVAFTLAANAVGTVTPVAEIVRIVRARAPRAVIVGDGVHAAQHRLLDLHGLDLDVLFCSAYKVFGPHLGIMAARRELLRTWPAYKVRAADDAVPWRWETGTLNHEGLAGLVAAVDYVAGLGSGDPGSPTPVAPGAASRSDLARAYERIGRHEAALSDRFLRGLPSLDRARLFGIAGPSRVGERTPTFALRIDGLSPRAAASSLAERGVFVWDGNYFALAIMERLGLDDTGGAVRVGFCHYHLPEEVDRVLEELAALSA